MTSVQSSLATATEMIKEVSDQVAKDRQELDEEKKKWEEEKAVMHKKFTFSGPRIILDVGGVRFSTSRSTLTKYPESMLGIMFSGRHDLETMQCKDGSFFIDRDGTHFRHILNYLRDGDEVADFFLKSTDVLLELIHEAKFYQLDNLTTLLKPMLHEIDVVIQDQITCLLEYSENIYGSDYGGGHGNIKIKYRSKDEIKFKHKNMRGLSFNNIRFSYAVSFVDCDLTRATFQHIVFASDAICTFTDCILDNTSFNFVNGWKNNSNKVSFTGCKTDKTSFDGCLMSSLKSAGIIP